MTYGFTRHARAKMRQLGVRTEDVDDIPAANDAIEHYPDRKGARTASG